MKSILLQVDDSIYEQVISFLSLLPQEKAEYFTGQRLSPLGLDRDSEKELPFKEFFRLPMINGHWLNLFVTDNDGEAQWRQASQARFLDAYSDEDSIYDRL